MNSLESKVTSQPKDMEQLKNEAREDIEEQIPQPENSFRRALKSWLIFYIPNIIEKAHQSGRESMRDECVEVAKSKEEAPNLFDKERIIAAQIISALKKIKL